MVTKTLTITQDAYDLLKSSKHTNESFSDVIKRVFSKQDWTSLAGLMDEQQAKKMQEQLQNIKTIQTTIVKKKYERT